MKNASLSAWCILGPLLALIGVLVKPNITQAGPFFNARVFFPAHSKHGARFFSPGYSLARHKIFSLAVQEMVRGFFFFRVELFAEVSRQGEACQEAPKNIDSRRVVCILSS